MSKKYLVTIKVKEDTRFRLEQEFRQNNTIKEESNQKKNIKSTCLCVCFYWFNFPSPFIKKFTVP